MSKRVLENSFHRSKTIEHAISFEKYFKLKQKFGQQLI